MGGGACTVSELPAASAPSCPLTCLHSPSALPCLAPQVVCVSRGFGNVLGWAAEDVIGKARW